MKTQTTKRVFTQKIVKRFLELWEESVRSGTLVKAVNGLTDTNFQLIQKEFPSVYPIFEELFIQNPNNAFLVMDRLIERLDSISAAELAHIGLSAHEIVEIVEEPDGQEQQDCPE